MKEFLVFNRVSQVMGGRLDILQKTYGYQMEAFLEKVFSQLEEIKEARIDILHYQIEADYLQHKAREIEIPFLRHLDTLLQS